MPSLKPIRLRGVPAPPSVGREEAFLEPPQRDAAAAVSGQVPDRVERHLRVVRAGLDADVSAGLRGVELVLLEAGKIGQLGWPLAGKAEAAVEQPRPEADREREPGRVETTGFTGVVRRRKLTPAGAGVVTAGEPGGKARPAAEKVAQLCDVGRGHVVARELQVMLLWCEDPRLVVAVERDRPAGARAGALATTCDEHSAAPCGDRCDTTHTGKLEQPPPAQRPAHCATMADIFESGSASLSTTRERSRRSAGFTVV